MALTESEELELLELEELQSKSSTQPPQAASNGYFTGTDLRGSTDPLARIAQLGQYANRGNQQLAGLMAEKSGQYEARRSALAGDAQELPVPQFLGGGNIQAGAIPGVLAAGTLATASEFLMPQSRLGAAAVLTEPIARGYQAARQLLAPTKGAASKPGWVAQLGSARTKVPASDIQQAIDDPSVFTSPSVQEANAAYGQAAGPLKSAARSLSEKTGNTILGEADFTGAINRAGRLAAGTELDAAGNVIPLTPQDALEGVQSINRFVKNREFTKSLDPQQFQRIGQLKSDLLDYLESTGTSGMREAATNLRKAHVNENLSKLLPQNKYGSTDAARTMLSSGKIGTAAAIAAAGYPLPAIAMAGEAALTSPAVLGGAIRNYQSISQPGLLGSVGYGTNAAITYFQDAYSKQKNKTPIKFTGQ